MSRQSFRIFLVTEVVNHEEENALRAFTRKRKAEQYADLRRRTETAVGGRKGFRVVTVPLIVDPSSPVVSGRLRADRAEAVE